MTKHSKTQSATSPNTLQDETKSIQNTFNTLGLPYSATVTENMPPLKKTRPYKIIVEKPDSSLMTIPQARSALNTIRAAFSKDAPEIDTGLQRMDDGSPFGIISWAPVMNVTHEELQKLIEINAPIAKANMDGLKTAPTCGL